jgi:hypothetical protein
MSNRVGKEQLRTLMMLGSPFSVMLTADRGSRAMVKRGLLKLDRPKHEATRITASGLHALADAMERGEVDAVLKVLKAKQKAKARKLKADRRQ